MARTLIVTSGFAVGDTLYRKGRLVAADDPIVAGREHLLRPAEVASPVERATAAPGEKRDVTPPAPPAGDNTDAGSEATNDWNALTKAQLVDELKSRDLPHKGTKAELVARLEEAT